MQDDSAAVCAASKQHRCAVTSRPLGWLPAGDLPALYMGISIHRRCARIAHSKVDAAM